MSQQVFNGQNLGAFPSIQPGITNLHLNNVHIASNLLSEIPESIGDFTSITFLDLGSNAIEALPKGLFNLINLTGLHIYNNKITSLPEDIGNLKKLADLHMSGNQITRLPKEIGELISLTNLILNENKLEYLPIEIANLKNLTTLHVENTGLPLPPNYNASTPHETIKYILENQKIPIEPPQINTSKAFFFKNISKPIIDEKFTDVLGQYSKEIKVDFNYITQKSDISKDLNVVFFIITFDIHNDNKLVFTLIDACIKNKITYFILFQKSVIENDFQFVNITLGEKLEKNQADLISKYKDKIKEFNSYTELENIISSALKQHTPKIILKKLYLENIGHFKNLDISFDEKITCLVGENGSGKSTILKSLALASIGYNHKNINQGDLQQLLRIHNLKDDGNINYDSGLIRLTYTIDGDENINELKFIPKDEGREIETEFNGSKILSGNYNLKSLIVGFPQLRGYEGFREESYTSNKITQPHINDLIPLINNNQDKRLQSFMGWIVNLDLKSLQEEKKEDNNQNENKEKIIIKKVFEIISLITKHKIEFKQVKSASPPEIWVKTYDSPNGVPLNLISQGFKIVMGWVGYYLERIIEAFPLSTPDQALKESAILMLDEIDSSIHPKWQAEFLKIIRETFPNTQFIFTTHSPLIISGLDKEQIIEFELGQDSEIKALANQIDTWVLNYSEILHILFNTPEPLPLFTIEELEQKLEKISKEKIEERQSIQDSIERLKSNIELKSQVNKYESELKERQNELDELIKKYKEKLQK